MPSEDKEPQRDIASHADSLPKSDPKELMEKMEIIVAEYENSKKINIETKKSLNEYVKNAKKEIEYVNKYRLCATIVALILSTIFIVFLGYIVLYTPKWFEDIENNNKIYLILILSAGPALMTYAILRGVYRSHHERAFGDVPTGVVSESVKHIQE